MLSAIPSLPVLEIARAVAFYTEKLGFAAIVQDSGFAILVQDDVELHVWAANQPEVPGAEPQLAGSASCRIRVDDAKSLYQVCDREGIVHPNGRLAEQPWAAWEFTVLDADGNCVVFYQSVS
jgi:catechol 2,3-dioxygenase-like lactoylglutathione lyase family enzyme